MWLRGGWPLLSVLSSSCILFIYKLWIMTTKVSSIVEIFNSKIVGQFGSDDVLYNWICSHVSFGWSFDSQYSYIYTTEIHLCHVIRISIKIFKKWSDLIDCSFASHLPHFLESRLWIVVLPDFCFFSRLCWSCAVIPSRPPPKRPPPLSNSSRFCFVTAIETPIGRGARMTPIQNQRGLRDGVNWPIWESGNSTNWDSKRRRDIKGFSVRSTSKDINWWTRLKQGHL